MVAASVVCRVTHPEGSSLLGAGGSRVSLPPFSSCQDGFVRTAVKGRADRFGIATGIHLARAEQEPKRHGRFSLLIRLNSNQQY
jgi:hypothetical protein